MAPGVTATLLHHVLTLVQPTNMWLCRTMDGVVVTTLILHQAPRTQRDLTLNVIKAVPARVVPGGTPSTTTTGHLLPLLGLVATTGNGVVAMSHAQRTDVHVLMVLQKLAPIVLSIIDPGVAPVTQAITCQVSLAITCLVL